MKKLMSFTSILEAILGIFLIFDPEFVSKMLLGIEASPGIETIGRLAGIVYLCFGAVCFPVSEKPVKYLKDPAVRAMTMYNFLAAVYLGYLKFAAGYVCELLFPAVILHTVVFIYFLYLIFNQGEAETQA